MEKKLSAADGVRAVKILIISWLLLMSSPVSAAENSLEKPRTLKGPYIGEIYDNLRAGKIKTHQKLEIKIKADLKFHNPYDPEEVELYAVFTGPDQKTLRIPGFIFYPFIREVTGEQESYHPVGAPDWRVRFTPDRAGEWSYYIGFVCAGVEGRSEPVSFTVQPGKGKGFIRVDPQESGYFVFDNGELFLPIGSNVAWYDRRGMIAYEKWFAKMAENGANYARIWLAPWGFAPEWKDTGLGNYENRQLQAWQLDYLLELAEKHGIYLMICLINHGQFTKNTNPEWDENPYNVQNGGFLREPVEFLSNPEAKKLFQRKLRYISARWGYSPNIFSWEWFNEVNLTDGLDDAELLVPWMEEMKDYLYSIEPYNRLTSNSFSTAYRGDEEEWTTTAVDYLQIHKYNQFNWSRVWWWAVSDLRKFSTKPILIGEYGKQSVIIDPQGIHFHDGLWGGVFAGAAGSAMLWWWDTYIEPHDLYYHYQGLSKFFAGEDLHRQKMTPVRLAKDSMEIQGFGLLSPVRALIWIRSKKYNQMYFESAAWKVGPEKVEFPEVTEEITIPNLLPGKYRIESWQTFTGEILETRVEEAPQGLLVIKLPPFKKDIAYKIYHVK